MFRFFETIKIEKGVVCFAKDHSDRIRRTILEYGFENIDADNLIDNIECPPSLSRTTVKCRLAYDEGGFSTDFSIYYKKAINSLRIVRCDEILYDFKYTDRYLLLDLLEKKGDCDEIIIVKNSMLTDTSFSNIVLFDGDKWITPKTPLLRGTCRERLLRKGKIHEGDIFVDELKNYDKILLINAMRGEEFCDILNVEESIKL